MKRISCMLWFVAALGLVPPASSQFMPYEPDGGGFGAKVTNDPIAPDGTPIQCDLPKELHIRNIGGTDGAGLCVMSSINHAAYWHNQECLFDYQKWASHYRGGGWPEKVDQQLEEIARQRGVAKPRYIQIISRDLSLLKLAFKTGRIISITFGYSPAGRYGGAHIAHMVSLLHLDDRWACVLDNNFPGTYEWMTPDELLRAACSGQGQYWAHLFLDPGPPPVPSN